LNRGGFNLAISTVLQRVRYSPSVAALDVHVFYRDTASLDEAAIATAVSALSAEERAQFARFHFPHDARDYAAAHALLRTVLSRKSDRRPESWRFDKAPHGKPFLLDEGGGSPSFSLSHTRGMVACAVTSGIDVGVDVESVDREVNVLDIAARFFSVSEAQMLARLDPTSRRERFFDLWTLKEALAKATGVGLSESLAQGTFTIDAAGGVTLESSAVIDAHAWTFGLFVPDPRYRLAVAARHTREEPVQLMLHSVGPGV
jgi:4'-phosphopantetheinyl transferase